MKVSVITVVYNGERYLADAIRSVRKQSHTPLEYIVIDGLSTDRTPEIIAAHRAEIDHVLREKDAGLYDAMNKGIRMAGGDVIALLNSDDVYADADVLADVVQMFHSTGADAVYGDLLYVKPDDTNCAVRYWRSAPMHPRFFERGNVPPHPALFLRRDVYERIGLFNTAMQVAADYELMLRAFRVHGIRAHYYPRVLVKMRMGGTSNNSLRNIVRGNREILRAWRINNVRRPFSLPLVRVLKKLRQYFS